MKFVCHQRNVPKWELSCRIRFVEKIAVRSILKLKGTGSFPQKTVVCFN